MLRALILSIVLSSGLAASKPHNFESEGFKLQANVIKDGLEIPWAMQFLDSNRMIFTQREGTIKILDLKTKKLTPVVNAPAVAASGQGGMLDILLHPKFKENQLLYISFSHRKGSKQTTSDN